MKFFLWLAIAMNLALAGKVSAQSPIVVQLFDWSFAQISEVLPDLAEIGYTHIHVSPVQKSVENGKWWGKYQPLDFRKIEGPLGSREELMALSTKADEHGIKLVVDVVLNHMAASPYVTVRRGRLAETDFADFSKDDFHPYAPIHDWNNEKQVRNRWLFGALPDLNTASPSVREKLTNHLLDLKDCGVSGFRVDSARHIPPEDLKAVFAKVEEPGLVMGEIAERRKEVFEPYLNELPGMSYFDFPYLAKFAACLRGEEPLSELADRDRLIDILPDESSVRLLRNHDLDRGEAMREEGISDRRYRILDDAWQFGYAALFGMGRGIPYIFVDHPAIEKTAGKEHRFDRKGLREGIAFFQENHTEEAHVFWTAKDTLAWTLGDSAFVILSRGATEKTQSFPLSKMKTGLYRDIYSGLEIHLKKGVLTLPPLGKLQGYAFQRISL